MKLLRSQLVLSCVFFLFVTGRLAQDVGTIVTSDLFNEMLKNRNDDRCPAKGFYTYDAFIDAANSFPGFGTTGDDTARKKEIAAFFGQTSHETTGGSLSDDGPFAGGYCFVREGNQMGNGFYGRGPIQLTGESNYDLAGKAIGQDLVNNPDLVATDATISFKTAIWFWMTAQGNKPSCHDVITGQWTPSAADTSANRQPGYGVITNIINGGVECGKGQNPTVEDRIGFYRRGKDKVKGVGPGCVDKSAESHQDANQSIMAYFNKMKTEAEPKTEKMNVRPVLFWSSWNNKIMGIQLTFQLLVAIITAILVLTTLSLSREIRQKEIGEKTRLNSLSSCNFFSGKWVFDNQTRPLYNGSSCSFISFLDDGMACQNYGRKDLDYLYWKWQPHDCDLPRFNATAMLEKLRNKRLVYVGDSLNRNQWVSLVCMLESSIHTHLKHVHFNGSLVTLKAIEYNATIDFYWAPLLVESNCDDAWHHRVKDRVLRVDSIDKHARFWEDADVLVFNSYLWWRLNLTVLWGSFGSADARYEQLGMLRTYKLGLQTWADWLDTHVNSTKTRVFFVSMSPTHTRGEEWGKAEGENCYNETEPISTAEYWGSESTPGMMRLVEAAIKKLNERNGIKADLLNITQLSEYRKEAHPSIYRKHWDPLTKEQLENPGTYADCTHWCLPGVPDVWNHFLEKSHLVQNLGG